MAEFFKILFRGIITTLALPVIAVILAIYLVYCSLVFVYMLIRNTIVFFMGGSIDTTKEDLKAKEILDNSDACTEDLATTVSNIMHQAIAQNPEAVQAMANQQIAINRLNAQLEQNSIPAQPQIQMNPIDANEQQTNSESKPVDDKGESHD